MPARKKAARKSTKKAKRKATPKKAAKRAAPKRPAQKPAPARRSAPAAPSRPAPPAVPSAIGLQIHHSDFTTHDLDGVRRFYVELLGFSQHDHDPKMNYLFIQTGGSSSLGFMPPMPGMGEPSPAKEPTLYFMVADVDRAYQTLAAKGVMFEGPPADMPWGHRVVSTVDPEGRRVMLATRKEP
ncbi:MAG: VOC family protein [Hyphomicrobiales bacterium]